MELHLWLSLVVICILGALSPGPSLALVIKNTLNGGVQQGYATAISHGLGGWQQKGIMTATVGIIDMLWYVIIAFTISRGPILDKLKANSHIVDKVTGSFLILLAARVVWT